MSLIIVSNTIIVSNIIIVLGSRQVFLKILFKETSTIVFSITNDFQFTIIFVV
jgi:hypothetical protein